MKALKLKNGTHFDKLMRIGVFAISFIIIYLILVTSLLPQKYNLDEGDIAKANIKAPRQMVDEEATEAKREIARKSVSPPYVKSNEVQVEMIDEINNLFKKIFSVKDSSSSEEDKAKKLVHESSIKLNDVEFKELLALDNNILSNLQQFLSSLLESVYSTKIEENNDEDLQLAQDLILKNVNESDFSVNIRAIAIKICNELLKPNFFIDKEQYDIMIEKALKQVADVIIQKDEIIVEEGKPITSKQIKILSDLGLLNNNPSFKWYIYISLAILVAIVICLQWIYIYSYHKDIFDNNSRLILISLINCITIILARPLSLISPFLIPLSTAPMLLTILLDYKISIVLSILNTLLLGITIGFNIEIVLLSVLNAVIGSILIKKIQARNDILYSAIFIAIVNVLITFSMGILLSSEVLGVLKKAGFSSTSSILSGILTMGLLPFFENIFDIVTTIKLLELSNPNQPLLKKLLLEAPGTYHHSILVANLAEVAAEEVGANPVLARVGAYYHDVGKVRRPYFFKENQIGNDNPHNKISPNQSVLVITSHVKDGLELAKEVNLPNDIKNIIEEHHGTTLVKYFYITMRNSVENPEDIKEEEFRYKGKLPSSKESGIIMLSDSIEAAVRSINEPTVEKIETMVNNIVKDRLNDGQLNNCELTLRDIEKVKKSLIKALTGIHHQRIEYPKDKCERGLETKGGNNGLRS